MRKDAVMLENYCDECDKVLNAVVFAKDFHAHKIGRIRCPECGCVSMPCNECEDRDACGDCPWSKAEIVDAMSDEAYIRYVRANEPKVYALFKSGDNGHYYDEIIAKIETEGTGKKKVSKAKPNRKPRK